MANLQKLSTYEPRTNRSEILRDEMLAIRARLLSRKLLALKQGVIIPDAFIAEIEEFIERNSFAESLGISDIACANCIEKCCPRCLKAHAIKIAKEYGLAEYGFSFVETLFKCEIGHNGYYLDNEEVVKIDNG